MYYSISMHVYLSDIERREKIKERGAGLVRDWVEKRKKRKPLNHAW